MAQLVQCNRCLATAEAAGYPAGEGGVRVAYGAPPRGWLTIRAQVHLCPGCYDRAVRPERED